MEVTWISSIVVDSVVGAVDYGGLFEWVDWEGLERNIQRKQWIGTNLMD